MYRLCRVGGAAHLAVAQAKDQNASSAQFEREKISSVAVQTQPWPNRNVEDPYASPRRGKRAEAQSIRTGSRRHSPQHLDLPPF